MPRGTRAFPHPTPDHRSGKRGRGQCAPIFGHKLFTSLVTEDGWDWDGCPSAPAAPWQCFAFSRSHDRDLLEGAHQHTPHAGNGNGEWECNAGPDHWALSAGGAQ